MPEVNPPRSVLQHIADLCAVRLAPSPEDNPWTVVMGVPEGCPPAAGYVWLSGAHWCKGVQGVCEGAGRGVVV